MTPIEIEEALFNLASAPFEGEGFPYAFLEAFGNNPTTIKRLKSGQSNNSDVPKGVLQRHNIHIAICAEGQVKQTLDALRQSDQTKRQKAKFILATDGVMVEAENLAEETTPIVCEYAQLADHFGFFLALAGISTVREVRENSFDMKATGRLNKLYLELLNENPDWATAERRHDLNHFIARLIFCFFAEDTGIFSDKNLFTSIVNTVSARDASDVHHVIQQIFRAMNIKNEKRVGQNLPRWAKKFPYVNGGLFSGADDVPKFSKIAKSYFENIGNLNWTEINPDIFGSMIQAVAEEDERSQLGMHYTSVPNILKVLNPLFLDDLKAKLADAEDNKRKLLNLRRRLANIRVFDPACGSGNFLVIAYKEMRKIEAEINKRRGEQDRLSVIPLTNFRGIELRDFSAEIARLALIVAEYQCNVLCRGEFLARAEFLPLRQENWIINANALQIDWLQTFPAEGKKVKLAGDDLLKTPADQSEIDFENDGGETYICGNPPYLGSTWQSKEQKADLEALFKGRTKSWKSLDYVAGWFLKAADYGAVCPNVKTAFVSTNSICQGQQVPILWPLIFATGAEINFAYTSFKWQNLASHNAGVTVVIVGIAQDVKGQKYLYDTEKTGQVLSKAVSNINPYLVPSKNVFIEKRVKPFSLINSMDRGNGPIDGGNLLLSYTDKIQLQERSNVANKFIKRFLNSEEFIQGKQRFCLWIEEQDADFSMQCPFIKLRLDAVAQMRAASTKKSTNELAKQPYAFGEKRYYESDSILVIPRVSSENREYLPVGLVNKNSIIGDSAFALYDAPLWNMALIASRLHLMWISTVCGKLETRLRYSNTLGWNTFPVPKLTEKQKADLTKCAENILLIRERHFPATIADLYDPEKMPADLRDAHDQNDEVLERIYIGRRFKNDTERLEKLFDLYTKMTNKKKAGA